MADITSNDVSRLAGYWRLVRLRFLLVFALLLICCVAVAQQVREDKCERVIGRLAVAMKLDSYYSNCQCMTHSFDFSDSAGVSSQTCKDDSPGGGVARMEGLLFRRIVVLVLQRSYR